jgi:galactitol PTS system EIIB component
LDRKRRILIVCGTGVATSTVVADKVAQLLKRTGIQADIRRAITAQAGTAAKDADLIIATTQVQDVSIPVLSGLPYITNVGVQKLEEQIISILNSQSENPKQGS